MPARNIVIGQKITPAKAERARDLRRQQTPQEKAVWEAVRGNRLGGFHFRRQQVIAGFIVDFYCHAAALVVEIDGEAHTLRPGYDEERDRVLADRGLRVLHISNEAVDNNLAMVLEQIGAVCREKI